MPTIKSIKNLKSLPSAIFNLELLSYLNNLHKYHSYSELNRQKMASLAKTKLQEQDKNLAFEVNLYNSHIRCSHRSGIN